MNETAAKQKNLFAKVPVWCRSPAIALTIFTLLAVSSLARKSATFDEALLMASGARFLRTWDNSVNPENPPLLKAFYALPTMFMTDLEIPPVSHRLRYSYKMADEFAYGEQFLYGAPKRHGRHKTLLFLCRCMAVLAGVLLGLALYRVAAVVWGRRVAAVLLWIYALSPNVLAHTRLFTPDLGCTLFVFLTVVSLHLVTKRGQWRHALWLGLALGGALLSKFTGVLLLPCIAVQLLVHLALTGAWRQRQLWRRLVPQLLFSGVLALVLVNAFYLGRGFGRSLRASEYRSPLVRKLQNVPLLRSMPLPVPADYVRGFDIVANNNRPGFPNIFLGKLHPQGGSWWYYYIVVLASKTPLALLGCVVWGMICGLRGHRRRRLLLAEFAVVPVLLFLNFSFVAYRQLGLRYILPLWPFFILAIGFAVRQALRKGEGAARRRRVGGALLALYALTALSAYPDYLSYFNGAAGGSRHGWKRLVASNIDWGQDLPALAAWQRRNGTPDMFVLYHGQAPLDTYEVNAIPWGALPLPPYLAIGVTNYYLMQDAPLVRFLRDHGHPIAYVGGSIHVHALDNATLSQFAQWAAGGIGSP